LSETTQHFLNAYGKPQKKETVHLHLEVSKEFREQMQQEAENGSYPSTNAFVIDMIRCGMLVTGRKLKDA
jgi:hypothetical protein